MSIELRVDSLTVGYSGEVVLYNLSIEYQGPGLIQVLGPNGAGKSTLLKTICGLLKPISGRVLINGLDVTGKPSIAGKFVGYVPQLIFNNDKVHYPITLYELVACCYVFSKPWPRIKLSGVEREYVEKLLESLGLPREKWFKRVDELSGGERQRGFIARALVRNPPILLLDEPFSSIDPEGRVELAERIALLKREKLVIVASHDPTLLLPHTDMILLINRKTYFFGKPYDVLRSELLEKIYGRGFIEHAGRILLVDSHI